MPTPESDADYLAGAHRDWLAARKIIADTLCEWLVNLGPADAEHKAAAILARLAQHDPPLLIEAHKDT